MSLVLTGISVAIGRRRVVDAVDVAVERGQVMALLGRNGAGKTTLVRGLAGLLPLGGRAILDGRDLLAMPQRDRSRLTGYVQQAQGGAAARLSVLELLLVVQNSTGASWRARPDSMARAQATLALLGLGRFAHALLGELSGGEQQMVRLALALVRRPRLLLLDEPTSALDLANQLQLLEVIRDYTRAEGVVTLMIVHDLNLVSRFADRALMLSAGRPAGDGAVDDVLTEDNIARVYGVRCRVGTLAGADRPLIQAVSTLPAGGGRA